MEQKLVEESQTSMEAMPKDNRSWMRRTFSSMQEGSLRAQIFLLIITTMGSSFFLLPYSAKKIGIGLVLGMLTFSAVISFYSSAMLYAGYNETHAKTYNSCMTLVLGKVESAETRLHLEHRRLHPHLRRRAVHVDLRFQIPHGRG